MEDNEKEIRSLSEEELEKVSGGYDINCWLGVPGFTAGPGDKEKEKNKNADIKACAPV